MEEAQQIELEVPGVRALFIGEDDRVEAEAGTLAQRKGPLAFFEPGYAERRQLHLAQFFLDHGGQLGHSWLMAATPGPSSLFSHGWNFDNELSQEIEDISNSARIPRFRPIAKFPELPPLDLDGNLSPEKICTIPKRFVSPQCK